MTLIDWEVAVNTGVRLVRPGPQISLTEARQAVAQLRELSVAAQTHVREFTGMESLEPVGPATVVDRPGWIRANVDGFRVVLEPVIDSLKPSALDDSPVGTITTAVGSRVTGAQLGAVLAYLAGRVLGQYEFPVLEPDRPARLLFVAPNLAQAAKTLDTPADQLLRWVALHELTHALQFGGVPWLRPHLEGLLREILSSLELDPRAMLRVPDVTDLRKLLDRVREEGLAVVAIGAGRREALDRVQAFMAVLEGYAEHVMDAVGATVLDDLPGLRAALGRRRHDRSGLLKLLDKLLGMDLKLRQYEQGKAFCDGVVERAGIEGLNRVWASPDNLPSVAELDDPAGWLARTEPPQLRKSA